jgi:hypothetical protein
MSTVNFPTRIQNYSSTAIDNVFIDSSRIEHISIEPVTNGLSDHDTQLLGFKNIESISKYHNYRKRNRLINKDTIKEFITHLSNESWDSVSNSHDVDSKFNTFLNIFLKNFEASFPTKTLKRCLRIMNGLQKASKRHANINKFFNKLAEPVTTN